MKKCVLRACVAVLFASTVIPGCAMQSGREFDTAYVDQIVRGTTTKAEIRSHLGEPVSMTANADGDVWMYAHQQGQNWMGSVASAYTGKYKMTGGGTDRHLQRRCRPGLHLQQEPVTRRGGRKP